MIVALAGHVDHGKTSIVRALTGVDTDRLAEEKRRGLTIDLGFAYANFGDVRVGFVDVPGHHRFIHNMVAGIAGHQYALLAVAADDGVMPQSREHLEILELLDVKAGVVAVTKTDRAAPARCAAVERDIRALAAHSFLRDAAIIRVSTATGDGLATLRQHLTRAARAASTDCHQPFRLAVDRVFSVRGSGTVVTGTVVAGQARVGDPIVLASSGARLRVRGLRVQDRPAELCRRGDRAGVNLAGAPAGIVRGDWLLHPAQRQPVTSFAMRLSVLAGRPSLKHNTPLHIHHASSHRQGRALLIDSGSVQANTTANIDVVADGPLHVKVGDRVVLRDHGRQRTLGGGPVLDLAAAARRRRHPARLARLAAIRTSHPSATLAAWAAARPVDAAEFRRHWNQSQAQAERIARDLGLVVVRGHLVAKTTLAAAGDLATRLLTEHHRRAPASDGLAGPQLGAAAGHLAPWLPYALDALCARNAARLENGRYALAGHRAALPEEVSRTFAELAPLLDSTQPPSLGDIAKRLKRPLAKLQADLRPVAAFGLAVRVSDNRYFLPARLAELAETAAALAAEAPFTVRAFRDASGVGRNIVIEVLEHFDGKRFTAREGDTRRVIGAITRATAPQNERPPSGEDPHGSR